MQNLPLNLKVLDLLKNKLGIVTEYVGGTENRYYIRHSGYIWSVPEKYLVFEPNEINRLQDGK